MREIFSVRNRRRAKAGLIALALVNRFWHSKAYWSKKQNEFRLNGWVDAGGSAGDPNISTKRKADAMQHWPRGRHNFNKLNSGVSLPNLQDSGLLVREIE